MPPQLRDYQRDVIARTRVRLADGYRRVLIQAPTGAGKTHISSEILRGVWLKGRRGLFLAHRRRLIAQKSERLDLFGVPHGVIMAGVGGQQAMIQVASKDTLLERGVRGGWMDLPDADVVVVDEARTWLADEAQKLLSRYPRAVILGLDATPALPDGRSLSPFFEAMECTCPVSQLIREGHLVPLKVFHPDQSGGDPALCGDPVSHWRRHAEGLPTVLFAPKVAASLAAVSAFNAAGIAAEHIDNHTDDDTRDAVARRVASGETKVVANVGIWTEGVDIPELGCCQLLRRAESYTLFAQMVGRIMRPSANKKYGVLIDHFGAVLRHGFPDEDVEWSLDEGETVDQRVQKAKREKKRREPIVCPQCACVYSGLPACPSCGRKVAKRAKAEVTRDELLVEADRERRESSAREDVVRYWHRCLGVAANRGSKAGAAAQMFRAKFKRWPWECGVPNLPRGGDWREQVSDLYPQYVRSPESAA